MNAIRYVVTQIVTPKFTQYGLAFLDNEGKPVNNGDTRMFALLRAESPQAILRQGPTQRDYPSMSFDPSTAMVLTSTFVNGEVDMKTDIIQGHNAWKHGQK